MNCLGNIKSRPHISFIYFIIVFICMLCLLNLQQVYHFPKQNIKAPKIKKQNIKNMTIVSVESKCNRMKLNSTQPHRSIVASFGNGRLGNQLSNFASSYALMKEYGMYPYISPMQLDLL